MDVLFGDIDLKEYKMIFDKYVDYWKEKRYVHSQDVCQICLLDSHDISKVLSIYYDCKPFSQTYLMDSAITTIMCLSPKYNVDYLIERLDPQHLKNHYFVSNCHMKLSTTDKNLIQSIQEISVMYVNENFKGLYSIYKYMDTLYLDKCCQQNTYNCNTFKKRLMKGVYKKAEEEIKYLSEMMSTVDESSETRLFKIKERERLSIVLEYVFPDIKN